jgi:hypothetical protein
MKLFLEGIWDFICTVVLWFAIILAFFVGLFLMGATFKIITTTFMVGYYLL